MSASNPKMAADVAHAAWGPLLGLSTSEVFERMLGSQLIQSTEPFAAQETEITSMVGLAGKICGVMTVRCPTKAAVLMASKMLGIEVDPAGEEMWDAVGEVCNMIAGNFKNKISGMGDGCMLSLPTVITGGDYSLHSLAVSGKAETHLLFEGMPLIISLEVHG
jgi:chemotaxis protein CheX